MQPLLRSAAGGARASAGGGGGGSGAHRTHRPLLSLPSPVAGSVTGVAESRAGQRAAPQLGARASTPAAGGLESSSRASSHSWAYRWVWAAARAPPARPAPTPGAPGARAESASESAAAAGRDAVRTRCSAPPDRPAGTAAACQCDGTPSCHTSQPAAPCRTLQTDHLPLRRTCEATSHRTLHLHHLQSCNHHRLTPGGHTQPLRTLRLLRTPPPSDTVPLRWSWALPSLAGRECRYCTVA